MWVKRERRIRDLEGNGGLSVKKGKKGGGLGLQQITTRVKG
jgi:hypothetical protein